MKKLFVTFATALVFSGVSFAQDQGDIRATFGLNFGTKTGVDESGETGKLGLTGGVEYLATDVIGVSASYDFYFPSTIDGESADTGFGIIETEDTKTRISYFNIDGRYYFLTGDTQVYGLAGLGFATASVKIAGVKASDSEVGLNLGAGAIFPMTDVIGINVQAKYQTAYDGNFAIGAGAVYTF